MKEPNTTDMHELPKEALDALKKFDSYNLI